MVYLCQVVLPINHSLNDVKVVGVRYVLQNNVQSGFLQILGTKEKPVDLEAG